MPARRPVADVPGLRAPTEREASGDARRPGFAGELLVYPVVFLSAKRVSLRGAARAQGRGSALAPLPDDTRWRRAVDALAYGR